MFRYSVVDLTSEIDSFEKLVKACNKDKKNRKLKSEIELIERKLFSRIETLMINESSNLNPKDKTKKINNILKQKVRLAKNLLLYSNSVINIKNYMSSRLDLFIATNKFLFLNRGKILYLLFLLFSILGLSFSILLALLRFLFRKKRISKNKRRTNKKNLEDMNSEDLDDKLFDIIDRYSKNKQDMKLIMDLIKKKLSPVELEETLKKLKDNPLFKELFNEEEYNKFFKELKELLKDEINEFKCKDPNLYLKFMEEEKEEKYEYNHNKSTIGLMIKDKIVSKIKQNKKALKLILQNELKALAPKIKMFKNKKSNFKEVFETMNPEIKMELIKLIKIKREKIKNMKIGKIKNMNKFKSINKVKKAKFPKNPIIEEKIKSIKKMQKNLYKFEKINKLNKVKKNNKLNKIDKSYKINKNNNLQKNTYKNNNNVVETNKFLKQYSNILKKAKDEEEKEIESYGRYY